MEFYIIYFFCTYFYINLCKSRALRSIFVLVFFAVSRKTRWNIILILRFKRGFAGNWNRLVITIQVYVYNMRDSWLGDVLENDISRSQNVRCSRFIVEIKRVSVFINNPLFADNNVYAGISCVNQNLIAGHEVCFMKKKRSKNITNN